MININKCIHTNAINATTTNNNDNSNNSNNNDDANNNRDLHLSRPPASPAAAHRHE